MNTWLSDGVPRPSAAPRACVKGAVLLAIEDDQ